MTTTALLLDFARESPWWTLAYLTVIFGPFHRVLWAVLRTAVTRAETERGK